MKGTAIPSHTSRVLLLRNKGAGRQSASTKRKPQSGNGDLRRFPWLKMWNIQLQPFPLTNLQMGSLCLAFFQPASSEAACEPAKSCLRYQELSGSDWTIWLCMWLLLAMFLLCAALCCLQCWLRRRRRGLSSPRTLAVFAIQDVDVHSVYEDTSVAPGMLAKIHAHLQNLERGSASSRDSSAGHASPPSYGEVMKPLGPQLATSPRDVAPGEQSSRSGPTGGGQQS